MDKILILHHFEPYWDKSSKEFNTSFEEEMSKILDFVYYVDSISNIIITRFEESQLDHDYYLLQELCLSKGIKLECRQYGYGFIRQEESEYIESDLNKTWCQGNRDYHGDDDVLILEDWHHKLKGEDVLLAGAFEDECLNDMEAILISVDANYKKLDDLSVGSYTEYEFKGVTPKQLEGGNEEFYEAHEEYAELHGLEFDSLHPDL